MSPTAVGVVQKQRLTGSILAIDYTDDKTILPMEMREAVAAEEIEAMQDKSNLRCTLLHEDGKQDWRGKKGKGTIV